SIALYSLHAGGTMGSYFRDLRSPNNKPPALRNFQRLQLPILKRLGVNAIWFLPLWPRGYGVSDYWSVDPTLGTVEDLRSVVEEAHAAGLRVLGDLIPHGPHESSGLLKEHPEFVSRKEDGSVLYWWGCLGCDYANPGWQDYMARVATYWVEKADLDGWRVDCAAGAPVNWRPYDDNLPSWSGQWGGLQVMRRAREAMSKVKPGCVLLGECGNPPMLGEAQFIYDWPTEQRLFDIFHYPRGEWVRHIAGWLEFQRLALPEGAARGLMRFTENHDQMHSLWQLGASVARPIWALMALAEGFPLIYHEQEVGFEDFWAQVLATRRRVPELHSGTAHYLAVTCDQPEVLAFVREGREGASLVAINFGHEARLCRLAWPGAGKALRYGLVLPEGKAVTPRRARGAVKVSLQVPAGAWRVVVLRVRREELKGLVVPAGMDPAAAEARPVTWQGLRATVALGGGKQPRTVAVGPGAGRSVDERAGQLAEVTVEAPGGWRMVFREGLLAGIARGEQALLDGMWLSEGSHSISAGEPVNLRALLREKPEAQSGAGARGRPLARWQVSVQEQGLRVDWSRQAGDFNFASRYLVRKDGSIEGSLRLAPRQASERVIGELYTALTCRRAQRWKVFGFEGDVGGPFFVRHPTAQEITGRHWHPIQRLWEHSVQPLSLQRPAIGWQAGGRWVWLELLDYPSDQVLDDIYLREYAPDGKAGLTSYLAWMAGRQGRELSPQKPFLLRFRLRVGPPPQPRSVKLPVRFWADGARWRVENRYWSLALARNEGGQLRTLQPAGGEATVLNLAYTYTDYGILPMATDPLGRKYKEVGTTRKDPEPDCWIRPSPDELQVHFRGLMRRQRMFRSLASPLIQYELVYHFTAGPRVRVEHRVRAMVQPRGDTKAFLAQVLPVPAVRQWRAKVAGQELSGAPDSDAAGRVIESRKLGGPMESLRLDTAAGTLVLDNISSWGEAPQNLFLVRHRDRPDYVIFLAMLDGVPAPLDARWHGVAYDLQARK
ncbi:MAG: hypothetical protein J7M26_04855, partial [Armatimonadetes bacterium]|nr:hypothetical protein [Armatimonadota bacterium]